MADNDKFTGHFEVLDALRDVILASDPAKREVLRNTIQDWSQCDPEVYFWATGPQAPMLLHYIVMEIDLACDPDATPKPSRPVIRLVDRKPQGSA